MLRTIIVLPVFVGFAQSISWALFLPEGNTWVEQDFTMTVPPAPPPEVTTGPWYFWPSGGGVVQPVLGFMADESNQVNPDPPFPEVVRLKLWALPWNYGSSNNFQLQESAGIWVDEGAQIASTVSWQAQSSQWVQTTLVVSGAAAGQQVTLTTPASAFLSDSAGDNNTPETVCESELDGSQTGDWDFTVTFTDVTFRAANSNGVASLCESATDHSDGNGFISFSGFSMPDAQTCFWSTITLTPP
ncbi:hypothetical protein CALCODRAFT_554293 [Calocera cornea HHB12733]|uniref:Concanavalin A-like lectin/glucanase n=1 Tax=Calocera cornea HHB12733 TaxID=1353952 RepID=A0A165HFN4_9BASI|nr:hypothetical protein CALCODRAFT_554293 [Calocera cornea HHB12733]